jgi:hypothetical protein
MKEKTGKLKQLGQKETHVCDDCVTIVLCDEVLDLARRRIFYSVASNEVVCELVLLGVADLAVAVRPAIGSVCLGHDGV